MNNLLKTFTILAAVLALAIPCQCLSQEKTYRIGPRDMLTLSIYAGGEEQQKIDLTVSAQGMINIPFIGAVKADGLTVPELEAFILKPLERDYFVDPEVVIQIKEYHSLQYYISGAVKSPGLYETTIEATLMELIAKAGGVLPERGNIAYILRSSTDDIGKVENVEKLMEKKEPIKVDLKGLLDMGDLRHNPVLQSGDVVYIPLEKALNLAESKIYVEGEVKKPGVYDYQPGLTALNACILAGGFDQYAAPKRARIIRKTVDGQESIDINLDSVKQGLIPDIELQPGDRIHIPESWF